MPDRVPDNLILSNAERAMIKRIADRDGITEEEAANNLVKACLARRVKKKTGKNPARVYSIGGRK